MSTSSITPGLAAEMTEVRARGDLESRLPVIIAVEPPLEATGARDVDALATAVRAAQEPVVQRLASLGVGGFQRLALASAVEAELTPDQIDAIATEPSVRSVMLNRTVRVTFDDEP